MEGGEVSCRGRRVEFWSGVIRLPNGARVRVDRVKFPRSVAVLPVFRDGSVVLVRQYRPAVDDWVLEAPAGTVEPGEDPRSAAVRELEEEAGLRADPGRLIEVGEGYVSPGYSTEVMSLFIALDPEESEARPEEYEVIEAVRLPLREALARVRDLKTMLLLCRARELVEGRLYHS
ncbi:NUDIX hydrolase [Stetteria hydrogenophila]